MPRKHYRHKKNKSIHFTYNEKIIYLISLLITIILSLLISFLSGNNLFFLKNKKEINVPFTGSAVRKESSVRKEYEQYYREKQKKWNKEYQDILHNKEEIKKLEELEFERKKTK